MHSDWPEDWPLDWKKRRQLPYRDKYRAVLGIPRRGVCLRCRGACAWSFCSEDCRRWYQLRANNYYLRLKTFARDQGVCALCAAVTTDWQADHIVPVRDGGGCCGLENIQTLCKACHEARNKRLIPLPAPQSPDTPLWCSGTAWTPAQDAEVVALRAQGWGAKRLAKHLGRTLDAVKSRLRVLEPRGRKPLDVAARNRSLAAQYWTEAEDAALKTGYATMTANALATQLGRSKAATAMRLQLLGLARPKCTDEEKQMALAMADRGVDMQEIAATLDRPASSVRVLLYQWRQTPLSTKALDERRPLPPDILASAEDRPFSVPGRGRPVKAKKHAP